MRLGLIGVGRWGKCYISTIENMTDVYLKHVISRNPKTRALLPDDCTISNHWEDLIYDKCIDGLILAIPPGFNFKIATSALSQKIPILIEKPMTSSIDEANKLYDIACKNKTLAMVGHTHLFSSAYKKLKDIAGHMGKIKKIISIGGNWGPFRKNMSMIWDYAPHDIAMCLDAFEKYPKSISAERIEYIKTEESFGESININLDFGLDAHANIHVSNVAHEKKRYFEVQCEYGDLVYNDIELESKLAIKKLDQLKPENIPIDNIKPLTYLISDFCKKIASGAEFDDSLLLGVQVVKVLDSCQTILNEANKVEQKYLC